MHRPADADTVRTRVARAMEVLKSSRAWQRRRVEEGIVAATGWVNGERAYRTVVELEAPLSDVADTFTSDSLSRLPFWSAEYASGSLVAEMKSDHACGWRFRVTYSTPWPLADRCYDYEVWRVDNGDRVDILYESVPDGKPAGNAVLGRLHGTAYHLTSISPEQTRVEHLLVTDLGGRIPRWAQHHLLVGPMLHAQLRDAHAQRKILVGKSDEVAA